MEYLAPLLRLFLYGATVLIAGSTALRTTLSVPMDSPFNKRLMVQIGLGSAVILSVALAMVLQFLLTISGGDLSMALSPDFLGIAAQTPVGQVAVLRIGAVLVLVLCILAPWRWLALLPAIAVLISFGLEGHSLSYGPRWLTSSLVVVHVAIAAWWLSVIAPLLTVSREERDRYGEAFGRQAVIAVPVLLVAGSLLFGVFTGWQIDFSQDYQRRMLMKIVAVAVILSIAAANKLFFTGRPGFIWALRVEAVVALGLLALTAFLTATGPKM